MKGLGNIYGVENCKFFWVFQDGEYYYICLCFYFLEVVMFYCEIWNLFNSNGFFQI